MFSKLSKLIVIKIVKREIRNPTAIFKYHLLQLSLHYNYLEKLLSYVELYMFKSFGELIILIDKYF